MSVSLLSWELVYNQGGVQVYKRQSPQSSIHELKGVAILQQPMLAVLSVVLDYRNFKKWQPHLKTFERLKVISEREFINYAAMDMPWPVRPRDIVMKARFEIDEQNHWFYVHWVESSWPSRPVTDKYVRIPHGRVKWSLTPLQNGRATQVEFQALADPGGWIPAWLVNWFSKYMIADSFARLEKRIQQGQYNRHYLQRYKFVEQWY